MVVQSRTRISSSKKKSRGTQYQVNQQKTTRDNWWHRSDNCEKCSVLRCTGRGINRIIPHESKVFIFCSGLGKLYYCGWKYWKVKKKQTDRGAKSIYDCLHGHCRTSCVVDSCWTIDVSAVFCLRRGVHGPFVTESGSIQKLNGKPVGLRVPRALELAL